MKKLWLLLFVFLVTFNCIHGIPRVVSKSSILVNQLAFSQLKIYENYVDLPYDVNYSFGECLMNTLNDKGLVRINYMPEILSYHSPDTSKIISFCAKHKADVFLVPEIQYFSEIKGSSSSKLKQVNPGRIMLYLKLYDNKGRFIDSAYYNSFKLLRDTKGISPLSILQESVTAGIEKLIENLSIGNEGLSADSLVNCFWESYKIQDNKGKSDELKHAGRLHLLLYKSGKFFLESNPDTSKIPAGDTYEYISSSHNICLHSSGENMVFKLLGYSGDVIVVKPNSLENISKIYFRKMAESDITLLLDKSGNQAPSIPASNKTNSNQEDNVALRDTTNEPVFFVVEETASFMGGDLSTFRDYVLHQTIYPMDAMQKGESGKVFLQFCVNSHGQVCDIKVIRTSGSVSLDKEAIRVISASPLWKPGKQRGKTIKQLFTMPVSFIIDTKIHH